MNRLYLSACLAVVFCLSFITANADELRELNFKLFDAAKTNDVKQVKQLIEKGASVKARNRFGNSALIYASKVGNIELVKYLLDEKSEINLVNTSGENALIVAARGGHLNIVKYLLKQGVEVNHFSLNPFREAGPMINPVGKGAGVRCRYIDDGPVILGC